MPVTDSLSTRDIVHNTWTSKYSGLIYGADAQYGNRIIHVLHHAVPGGVGDSICEINPIGKVFEKIDDAWNLRGSGSVIPQWGGRTRYIIPMGQRIGKASPNNGSGDAFNIAIVIDNSSNSSVVITTWCQ